MANGQIGGCRSDRDESRLFLLSSSMFSSSLSECLSPARLQQHIDGLTDQRLNLYPWLTGPTFIERKLVECPR
jgi:hypothetical protein